MNAQQLWRPLEGQTIADKYILESLVGAGSFGGVFRGQWQEQGKTLRRIAIKLMPVPEDEAEKKRSFQELQLAVYLDHAHIVRCFDVGRCALTGGDFFYLVMELGTQSLQQRLERNVLNAEELQSLCQQVAEALHYLHNPNSDLQKALQDLFENKQIQSLVHRDLKPGNILQVGDGWKLCDLGIARAMRKDDYNTTRPMMTLAYAAPEAFEGFVSPASDIWALGITLVVAGTNRFPFPDSGNKRQLGTTSQLIEHIRQCRLQVPNLPQPIAEIVGHCLKKERTSRWTAQQILQRLQGTAPTVPHAPVSPRRPQTGRWALGLVLAMVAVAVPLAVQWQAARKEAEIAAQQAHQAQKEAEELARREAAAKQRAEEADRKREEEEKARKRAEENARQAEEDRKRAEESEAETRRQAEARKDRWTQQVREQLLRVARLIRTGGNRATHDPFIDELGNGGKDTISINLQKGIEYLIVGVCDEDCDDLDLVLRDDNGNIVSSDTKDNDVPIVRVTPRWNARFKIEVTMASCTRAPCRYGIGVFGNR